MREVYSEGWGPDLLSTLGESGFPPPGHWKIPLWENKLSSVGEKAQYS